VVAREEAADVMRLIEHEPPRRRGSGASRLVEEVVVAMAAALAIYGDGDSSPWPLTSYRVQGRRDEWAGKHTRARSAPLNTLPLVLSV